MSPRQLITECTTADCESPAVRLVSCEGEGSFPYCHECSTTLLGGHELDRGPVSEDAACGDPSCSYRAEIDMGYYVSTDALMSDEAIAVLVKRCGWTAYGTTDAREHIDHWRRAMHEAIEAVTR